MLTGWQSDLRADPIPWLLEWENPSARYLTLRHVLDSDEPDSQVTEARAAIETWPPVRDVLALMDPVDFWGRAEEPFYGGAMSTHATLHLLAELGVRRTPRLEAACENLFEHGQHESGGFTYDGTPGRVHLCYTGNAIRTLLHFGYGGDPRLERAFRYLARRAQAPDGSGCPYAYGGACLWGAVKALAAFADVPGGARPTDWGGAIERLADLLLDHAFDFEGDDAAWLDLGFPQDYQSDLVELCDVLARLGYVLDTRLERLLDAVLENQSAEGRWIKRQGTRVLQVEDRGEPSKWITIRALRALKLARQAAVQAEQLKLRNRESWFSEP